MAFKFEKLVVWKKAVDLANEIDLLVRRFPRTELFSLSSQIKRAADSVVLNIAEGSTGQSDREFRHFLLIALRSAVEVVACLHLARKRNYIEELAFAQLYEGYESVCKMISGLKNSLY